MKITYGDIILVDLSSTRGHEQGGLRPCIVVQNNVGNVFSNTTIIVPITSSMDKKYMGPTHFIVKKTLKNNLSFDCVVLCEQIRVIDRSRIKKKIGILEEEHIKLLKKSIMSCLNL